MQTGDKSTDFEHENYGTTLSKCQRYYYKEAYTSGSFTRGPHATQYETGHKFTHIFHPTTMRAAPTSTVSYSGGAQTEYQPTARHFKSYISSAYNDTTQRYITAYEADAEL